MSEKPKLQTTDDYSRFEMDAINRDLSEKPVLLASMKAHGFMPSSPIQCVRGSNGKLKVVRGHHRLHYAKRLKLHVWYVVDESNSDIYDLEGDSTCRWSLRDFLVSRAKGGDESCQKVLSFQKKHNLTQGAAISLLGGESAGSSNKRVCVKNGTFKVAADIKHALAVTNLTDHFRECGISFATQAALVCALSMVLRVPEFDPEVLKRRIKLHPALLTRRGRTKDYLDELDVIYNHGARDRRMPLKHRAEEVGRERQASFGKRG